MPIACCAYSKGVIRKILKKEYGRGSRKAHRVGMFFIIHIMSTLINNLSNTILTVPRIAKLNTLMLIFAFSLCKEIAYSQTQIQAVTPFVVQTNGTSVDVSKFGLYHNWLLDYAKQNDTRPDGPLSKCQRVERATSLANAGINSGSADLLIYFQPFELNCDAYNATFPAYYGENYEVNLAIAQNLVNAEFIQAANLAVINAEEKALLENFSIRFINQQPIDFAQIKNQWEAIQNKPYGGSYSAFLIVLGAYSGQWWNGLDPINPPQAFPVHDFLSGVVAIGHYLNDNMSKHYLPDFGIKMLKAGGNGAVHGSTFGLIRHLWGPE